MAVKLFVTDLDGTLLPSGCEISEENIRAVREAEKAGTIVTIATGRMYRAALPLAKKLGLDVPIITYNGALIKSVKGKVYYESYLKPELVLEVLDFCQERNWHVQLYSKDALYFAEENKYTDFYIGAQMIEWNAVGWEGLREHTEEVAKLLSITDDLEETNARVRELNAHFGGRLEAARSNPIFVEIMNPDANKAAGVRHLAEKLGISIEDTMAIGDSDNDIPMLKAAGKAVAMGNALPHVKEISDYVTGTCEENGFAEAIYNYVLK